jgi:outer membrane protein assembly factor BamA
MLRAIIPLYLIVFAARLACGAEPCAAGVAGGGDSAVEGAGAPPDSLPRPRSSFVILPYAYYSPETKVAFGAGSIYSFRSADALPDGRPSNIRIAATYTQLNQMILALMPELYLRNERYYYTGFYGYYRYPDKFWGVGGGTPDGAEENYRKNDFESNTSVQMRIAPGLYAGPLYEYQYLSVDETDAHGALRAGAIPGSQGGSASGLGVILRHDTRDNTYQPMSGFYNQISAVSFGDGIGSDYAFKALSIDLRMYRRSFFRSHVIAIQTYDVFISGEAPFQMLALLGGSYSMRGFYKGRYRDRNMITAQAEYRFPIAWRFGAAAFAGAGDVQSDLHEFSVDRLKYSAGFGLRFLFDAQEKINARLDFGFGSGDNAGIYAMVLEAF